MAEREAAIKRDSASPEAYRNDVSGRQRELLDSVRGLILRVAPDVEEGIQYGMLDYPGIANLAAQKHYISLYVSSAILARFKPRFPKASCGKSCLRFRNAGQVDWAALEELLAALRDR